jgi:hypothetical protein
MQILISQVILASSTRVESLSAMFYKQLEEVRTAGAEIPSFLMIAMLRLFQSLAQAFQLSSESFRAALQKERQEDGVDAKTSEIKGNPLEATAFPPVCPASADVFSEICHFTVPCQTRTKS